jgi:hypothetical protein
MSLTRAEAAAYIRHFLDGTGGKWDWDDFISAKLDDPWLDRIRRTCAELPDCYPPTRQDHYCSDEGLRVLRDLLMELSTPDSP